MDNDFITIREASRLVEKSQMTIWRLIQKVLKSDKDSVKADVRREEIEASGGIKQFRFLISEELVRKVFGLPILEVKEDVKDSVKEDVKGLAIENEFLKQNIQNRERAILELKTELKEERDKNYQSGLQMGFLKGQVDEIRKLLEAPKKKRFRFFRKQKEI